MKIAIDVSQVIYGTGVSVYTQNLVRNLLEIDKTNEYLLFGGSLRRKEDLRFFLYSLKGNFEPKILNLSPLLSDLVWNRIHRIRLEKLIGSFDILHSSDWSQPATHAKKITTIHDLTPIIHPKEVDKGIVGAHTRRFAHVKNEVDMIIVPSKATKRDLEGLGVEGKRIKVIYEASDPTFKKIKNKAMEKTKSDFKIRGKYLLAFGHSPRKNANKTIEAFNRVKKRLNISALVIVGKPDLKRDGVVSTGFVSKEDLAGLLSGAEALIYPSFYEGFGLPILEAFAVETPVVTSNISSMPEVAGKAAALVDPYDSASIARGIVKVVKGKQKYVQKGKRQLKKFSWRENAMQTLDAYNSLSR